MKSKFFKDTQGLGECYTRCPPGQVCVCLRMDRGIYGQLLRQAEQCGMTSGQYIQQLMAWHSGVCGGYATEQNTAPVLPDGCGCAPDALILTGCACEKPDAQSLHRQVPHP